jgi:activating signal cointegrator 1
MKAITIWQPWASLKACDAKQFETRGWATRYRGPIAIHAASLNPLKLSIPLDAICEMRKVLTEAGILKPNQDFRYLPLGAIIATGELVDCHEIVLHGGRGIHSGDPGWLETDRGIYEPTDQELLFGDWTPGRYAWEITNVKMLPEPIPAKGKQRLWNWEEAA